MPTKNIKRHAYVARHDYKCEVCGNRVHHLLHKAIKPVMYVPGEIVGKYVVGINGEFRTRKDADAS